MVSYQIGGPQLGGAYAALRALIRATERRHATLRPVPAGWSVKMAALRAEIAALEGRNARVAA